MSSPRTYSDITCTMCGCVCDDLRVEVDGHRVVSMSPACSLAEPWFLKQDTANVPPAAIHEKTVSIDEAIAQAAAILQASRSPLVYGLSRSSTPGQRAAVRLADRLGGYIDTTASTCHAPSIMALQSVGESTASLGEIRNRSDLVVYWGSNPLVSHPRHMERCVDVPRRGVVDESENRHVVVVDVEATKTSAAADTFIRVEPGRDFELIWALRALLKGLEIGPAPVAGVEFAALKRLAERLRSCRYGVVFFGLGLTKGSVPHANVEALLNLVTDLNADTRFVARRMRIPGDVAGADSVLCWQTGFPFSVSLTRGYPRYCPGEYTADQLLERREVDAVVLVGTEGVSKLSAASQKVLRQIPSIVLDYPGVQMPFSPSVQFTTAVYGIHERGTAYRMDEVPIPLRAVLDSPLPSDHRILNALTHRLSEIQS